MKLNKTIFRWAFDECSAEMEEVFFPLLKVAIGRLQPKTAREMASFLGLIDAFTRSLTSFSMQYPEEEGKYFARGLVPIWGRSEYTTVSRVFRVDIFGDPDLLSVDPTLMVKVAINRWKVFRRYRVTDIADTLIYFMPWIKGTAKQEIEKKIEKLVARLLEHNRAVDVLGFAYKFAPKFAMTEWRSGQSGNKPVYPVEADIKGYVDLLYATNRQLASSVNPPKYYDARSNALTYGGAAVSVPEQHRLGRMERPFGGFSFFFQRLRSLGGKKTLISTFLSSSQREWKRKSS